MNRRILIRCLRAHHTVANNNDTLCVSKMLWPQVPSKEDVSNILNGEDAIGCKSARMFDMSKLLVSASPGSFYILPFLARALHKLHWLIDHEMQSIGAQRVTMPCLSPGSLWKATNRWVEMGSELIKVKDRHDKDYCLAPTHEEAITAMVASLGTISSKDLPIKLFQIGRKFRDEMRPKHGLLRGREFEMKDLYIFDFDLKHANQSYSEVCEAYCRLLNKLGLQYEQVEADTGAMGGSQSHEFHLCAKVGEDTLYKCTRCNRTMNKELLDNSEQTPFDCKLENCTREFEELSGIEVAHAFILGRRYSSIGKAISQKPNGEGIPLYMSCYGIGVTRLLASSVEVLSSDVRLRWPGLLAPYQICIIPQKEGYRVEVTSKRGKALQQALLGCPGLSSEVILDDRLKLSIGRRVGEAKFLGFPYLIIAGKKVLEKEPLFELIDVYNDETELLTHEEIVTKLGSLSTVPV